MSTDARLAVIEARLVDVLARLAAIEEVVLELRLESARYEWLRRIVWLALGAVVPVALAVLISVARVASTARLP